MTHAGPAGSESAQQRWCCTLWLRPGSQQLRCSCMANKQLSIVLYRTVWRWARAANGVPYHLRFEDVCTVAPACLQPIGDAICAPSVPLQESAAVRAIARRAFRDSAHLQVEGSLTTRASNSGVGCPALTPAGRPVRRGRQQRMRWTAGWRCALLLCSSCCTQHAFIRASPVAYLLARRQSACCTTTTPATWRGGGDWRASMLSVKASHTPSAPASCTACGGADGVAWLAKNGSSALRCYYPNAGLSHSAALGVYLTSCVARAAVTKCVIDEWLHCAFADGARSRPT